ncbi:MAG: cell division protein FtsZ [Bacteroidetes bacterium]|nr:cell division protein FtsZ [Bacteroidota bacterium]
MEFITPEKKSHIIKVFGVGGGGGNAVNHMFRQGIEGVDFIIANTDKQALNASPVPTKYQIGQSLTEGLGAGADPETGKKAALESIDDIKKVLADNTKMVFITAGMGGGTGTGAAPIIAKTAREMGILTVGIVTTPFKFEGKKRMDRASDGIAKMKESVDSLLVINNEKLRDMYGNLPLNKAFEHADNILATAAKSIAEIITFEGYVNVDFMDVRTVMANSGVALMGTAQAEGDQRAITAAKKALLSPLLAENDIKGAKNILVNITFGKHEILTDEVMEITDFVRMEAGEDADLIFGCAQDHALGEQISVTIIATAFESKIDKAPEIKAKPSPEFIIEDLTGDLGLANPSAGAVQEEAKSSAPTPPEPPVQVADKKGSFDVDHYIHSQSEHNNVILDIDRYGNKMGTPEMDLNHLEKVPAYLRRNRKLEPLVHSSVSKISKLVLNTEDLKKPEIRPNNRYLNDNVD